MGLFNSYVKPGPGVSKDAPQKTAFFLFFDIYFRKFWDLIKVNLLYFISIVLFFIPVGMILIPLFADFKDTANSLLLSFHNGGAPIRLLNPWLIIYLLPIGLAGPATAGFTYIMRNFAREEHAFLWSDYKDTIKSNWKQALAAGLIQIVASTLLIFAMSYYYQNMHKSALFVVPFIFTLIVSMLFLFMQYYIYVLIITFRLTLSQIYRNSLIFAFLGLGRNFLVTIFCAVTLLLSFYFLPLAFILVPCLTLSTMGLIVNFCVWPVIKKYMIDPNPENQKKQTEESVFEDTGREK